MLFLDTNYLIRFFTRDEPKQFEKAKKVILGKDTVKYVSPLVLAETAYILSKHYKVEKDDLIRALWDFLSHRRIKTEPWVYDALILYKRRNVSFYDALIVCEARYKKMEFVTFDKKLEKIKL